MVQTIAANPENGNDSTVAAPTTQKATESTQSKGPGSPGTSSSEVVSATRNAVVAYAKQFLGNPYVWGGTSLTSGADCSGFVLSVFKKYGVSLPHSSAAQSTMGSKVSLSEAQPGDLIFYAQNGRVNHVAIYIGNGQVIHASNPRSGIKISNATYRTPYAVKRVLNQ